MSAFTLNLSFGDDLSDEVVSVYSQDELLQVFTATLAYIGERIHDGLLLPEFIFEETFAPQDFCALPKSLDIYVCGSDEGHALNWDARGKDYATNILSYPSGLPNMLFRQMGEIPLGELVICHDVVVKEACEQGKTFQHHLTHLVVHGILHLLGFDHELGQAEQDEMEVFEIGILAQLGIANPYDDVIDDKFCNIGGV